MITDASRHHSYIYAGDTQAALARIQQEIEVESGRSFAAHPDVYFFSLESFAVAHSRELKERAAGRALTGRLKYIIAVIGSITPEAQNALLKVLEEPVPGTRIYLVVRAERMFIETVLSRCEVVLVGRSTVGEDGLEARQFISSRPAVRATLLAAWHKDERLTKSFLSDFLDEIERLVASSADRLGCRRALVVARQYLYDRACLPKMIIEYLSVTLPVVAVDSK